MEGDWYRVQVKHDSLWVGIVVVWLLMGRGAECVEVRALAPEELPAGLPTGWKVEVWVRKNGATAGSRDMVFGKSLPFVLLVLFFIGFRSQTWGGWINFLRSSVFVNA